MKSFVCTLLLLFSFSLFAAEIKLAVITSDIDPDKTDFHLLTNDASEVESLRFVTTDPNGRITDDDTYPIQEVIEEGVILVERNGYNVVFITSQEFDVVKGGTFRLSYLYSGLTGVRRLMYLSLRPSEKGFSLFHNDKQINRMFFKANRSNIFGLIGIREIQTSLVAGELL